MSELVITSQLDLKPAWEDLINACSELTTDSNQLIKAKATTRLLAKKIGKSMKSVQIYVHEMVNRGLLTYKYKVGRNGGLELNFNGDYIHLTKPSNKGSNGKFVPRGVINKKLNQRYLKEGIKWDMFLELPQPELSLWGFLLGRIYDLYYRMYRITYELEQENIYNVETVSIFPKDKIFGTAQLTNFEKLAEYCLNENINPLYYMTSVFRYSWYIHKSSGNRWVAPYHNTFLTPAYKEVYKRYAKIESKAYAGYFDKDWNAEVKMSTDLVNNSLVALVSQMWDSKVHGNSIDELLGLIDDVDEMDNERLKDGVIAQTIPKEERSLYDRATIAYTTWRESLESDLDNMDLTTKEHNMFVHEMLLSLSNQWEGSELVQPVFTSEIAKRYHEKTQGILGVEHYRQAFENNPSLALYYGEKIMGYRSFRSRLKSMGNSISELSKSLVKNQHLWNCDYLSYEAYHLVLDIMEVKRMPLEDIDNIISKLSDKTLKGFSRDHLQPLLDNMLVNYEKLS